MTDSRTQVNIRITEEDAALLARLERAYGLNTAGVTRFAWRYLEEHGPMKPKERTMKTVTVRTEQELRDALTAAGLTPTLLPTLPVEVAGLRIEWQKTFYEKRLRDAYDAPILVAVVQNGIVTEEFTRIAGGEVEGSGAPWGTLGLTVEELHERGFRKRPPQPEHPGA
ncbi:MAG: hypothetical protein PHQ60_15755 [Sideroxydans sp.]|nr:hypothetical protein [Sideroxydans sp.]